MIRVIIPFLALLIPLFALAQPAANQRVEIETRGNADKMHIVPVNSEGVVLFSEVDQGRYSFTRYTTDLQQDWSVEINVNPTLDLTRYIYRDKALYLLFSRYKSPIYQIVKLNVRAGFAAKYEWGSIDRLEIIDFEAIGNYMFIAGRTNNEPVLLHTSIYSKQARVLPTAFRNRTEIQSLEMDSVTHILHATFVSGKNRDRSIIIRSFTPEGQSVQTVNLATDDKNPYELLSAKVSDLSDNEELVLGTYGTQGPVYARASTYNYYGYGWGSMYQGSADYSQGVYISKLQNGQKGFTKYYSFTDFKNFFRFLGGKQQERMESKIQKRKKQGKDLRLQYRLLVHDIVQRNGQYIMIAEAYYPEYRSNNNYMYPGPWGYGYGGYGYGGYSPYGRNIPIFDGWVYTHAVIAGFDQQGNLLWDNSFEINDVKTYRLKEKIKVSFDNENIMLAYNHNGELKTKVIRGNEVVEAKGNVPISTEYQGDKVRKSYTDEIEYWYGNHFLAWGYQKIRNAADEQVKSRRNVFYFTKVGF